MTAAENVLNYNYTHTYTTVVIHGHASTHTHAHTNTKPLKGGITFFVTISSKDLALNHLVYTTVNKIYLHCQV